MGDVGGAEGVAELEHDVPGAVRPRGRGLVRAAADRVVVVAGPVDAGWAVEEVLAADAGGCEPCVVAGVLDPVVVVVEEDAERRRHARQGVRDDCSDVEVGRRIQEANGSVTERSVRDAVGGRTGPLGDAQDAVDRRRRRRRARNVLPAAVRSGDARGGARERREDDARQSPVGKQARPYVVRPSTKTVNRHRPSLNRFPQRRLPHNRPFRRRTLDLSSEEYKRFTEISRTMSSEE